MAADSALIAVVIIPNRQRCRRTVGVDLMVSLILLFGSVLV